MDFFDKVEQLTVKRLTRKKAEKIYKKQHRTFLNEVLDWLDAIVFAVIVILILNTVLFQLFLIPSPSMEQTLHVGSRVLDQKNVFGIEVYPMGPKIFEYRTPDRDDIITFYNPEYESKGPFFNVFSNVLYMATFSLVNIDKDENGNPREKLLVKRCAALPGDTVTFDDGNAYIKPAGFRDYVNEFEFRKENGMSVLMNRTADESIYENYKAMGKANGFLDAGLQERSIPSYYLNKIRSLDRSRFYSDSYAFTKAEQEGRLAADVTNLEYLSDLSKSEAGVYVPEGYVLPLGDNRDNSYDGRYFGPVETCDINGKITAVLWASGERSALR